MQEEEEEEEESGWTEQSLNQRVQMVAKRHFKMAAEVQMKPTAVGWPACV